MKDWSVQVMRLGDEPLLAFGGPEDEKLADLSVQLVDVGGAITSRPDTFTVRVHVPAPDAGTAIADALEIIDKAIAEVGLPSWPVVHVEATEWSEFERRTDEPTYPGLIGLAELAARLKISKQRASELARTSHFPKPYVHLAAGPVWLEPTIESFVSEWKRKPGRPRKVDPETTDS